MHRFLCLIGLHRLQHDSGAVFTAFLSPRFLPGRLECKRCGIVSDDWFR